MANNVILTGLMGTGKTTLGRHVANKLNRTFIDTDEYIEAQFGPAASIFSQPNGDIQFRAIEEQVANELSAKQHCVISTGGRFMLNQSNIDVMQHTGVVVCLVAELSELVERLSNTTSTTYRPRFVQAEDKLKLMQQLEQQSASYFIQFKQITTTGRLIEDIAEEIITLSNS